QDRAVVARQDVEALAAADLQQEVDLRVHVEGRRLVGRGQEDVPLAGEDAARTRVPQRLDFGQAGVQQLAVRGVQLDLLEHDPRVGLRDAPETLLDGQAGARDL